MEIINKIAAVRNRVEQLAQQFSFCAEDVKLLGAVKYTDGAGAAIAIQSGLDFVGENKAQALMDKFPSVPCKDKWHFIGQLQSNKVRQIIDKVSLVHSLDRQSLAQEIDRCCQKACITMDALVEINIVGQHVRGGVSLSQADDFISGILDSFEHIRICGLMTVLPHTTDKSVIHEACMAMQDAYLRLGDKYGGFKYLSMGMSNDYQIALQYGANLIRLGSALFI